MKLPETFFSSPSALIWKMKAKIQGRPKRIIDPSAGDGAILDLLNDKVSKTIIQKTNILNSLIYGIAHQKLGVTIDGNATRKDS